MPILPAVTASYSTEESLARNPASTCCLNCINPALDWTRPRCSTGLVLSEWPRGRDLISMALLTWPSEPPCLPQLHRLVGVAFTVDCVALPDGLALPSGLAYALLHRLAGLASSSTCVTFPARLTLTTPQLCCLANLASPSTATPRPPRLFLAYPLTVLPCLFLGCMDPPAGLAWTRLRLNALPFQEKQQQQQRHQE